MPQIVLTEEQSRIVTEATEPVEIRDVEGRLLTHILPLNPEDQAVLERHRQRGATVPRGIPSEQVQAHLRRLAEIREREGLDEAKMLELLRRMQAGEQL
jgi:hypothetical protein